MDFITPFGITFYVRPEDKFRLNDYLEKRERKEFESDEPSSKKIDDLHSLSFRIEESRFLKSKGKYKVTLTNSSLSSLIYFLCEAAKKLQYCETEIEFLEKENSKLREDLEYNKTKREQLNNELSVKNEMIYRYFNK